MMPASAVAFASVAYAVVFSVLGADRYATFHSGADLGLFVQTIASAFSGFRNTVEGTSHFAYHFSPILYLLAPLLWLTRSAFALVVVQAFATAAIVPAIYAIARKRTSDAWAAGIACIALLYPPLQGVTFTDFHEVGLAPAAVAWLLWAIDARRFGIAAVLLAAVLSIKEDQAPAMAFLGVAGCVYFGRRGERGGFVFSAMAAAAAMAVFGAYFTIVRPLAGAQERWIPSHFYAWGEGAPAIPLPAQIIGRLTYALEALVPLAFLPLRSPVILLAIPGFAEVLASREPLTYTMGQHYAAAWIPYVLVAFALSAARLLERSPVAGARWIRASAVLCVLTTVFFSPLHLGHFLRMPQARDAATRAAIAALPRSASIGTYDEIYAHLGFFPGAAIGIRAHPEYVLYDQRYVSSAWSQRWFPAIARALAGGAYAVVSKRDGVIVLQSVPATNGRRSKTPPKATSSAPVAGP
ncbi:MAG TPA: DUF2079 domain-containing protein [Candidatus Tumulicola sp.]|jgi:uncharacterized membrane protein